MIDTLKNLSRVIVKNPILCFSNGNFNPFCIYLSTSVLSSTLSCAINFDASSFLFNKKSWVILCSIKIVLILLSDKSFKSSSVIKVFPFFIFCFLISFTNFSLFIEFNNSLYSFITPGFSFILKQHGVKCPLGCFLLSKNPAKG